jgi:hypothetical protein
MCPLEIHYHSVVSVVSVVSVIFANYPDPSLPTFTYQFVHKAQNRKSYVLLIAEKACNKVCNAACQPKLRLVIKLVIFMQGCRARLPGKASGQGVRARLLGKAAGQGCMAMVQYAESMLKLDNNAVF